MKLNSRVTIALTASLLAAVAGCELDPEVDEDLGEEFEDLPGTINAAGEAVLKITEANWCRTGHSVMQGMTTDFGSNLYIVFTKAKGADPVLTRWTLSGSSWTCAQSVAGLELGHANDLTFHANFSDVGRALLITRGATKTENRDNTIAVIALNADGSIGTQRDDLVLPNDVSGFCFSATAADGEGRFAGRLLSNLYVFPQEKGKPAFNKKRTYSLKAPSDTADQGLDCSRNYIWSARSIKKDSKNKVNHIYQVTWSGSAVQDIKIESPSVLTDHGNAEEIEDVTHLGTSFFVGINRNSKDDIADLVRTLSE